MTEQQKMEKREELILQLRELGALKSFDSLAHLYHANVVENPEDFYFKKDHDTGENISFFHIRGTGTFYATEDLEYAKKHLNARYSRLKEQAQKAGAVLKASPAIHDIIASNPSNYVYISKENRGDEVVFTSLRESNAFKQLAQTYGADDIINTIDGEILDWRQKRKVSKLVKELTKTVNERYGKYCRENGNMQETSFSFILQTDLVENSKLMKKYEKKYNMEVGKICQYIGAVYAQKFFEEGDFDTLINSCLLEYADKNNTTPTNKNMFMKGRVEYIKSINQSLGIDGMYYGVGSEKDRNYFFWNLDNVNTRQFIEKRQKKLENQNNFNKANEIVEQFKDKKVRTVENTNVM